MKRIVQGPSGHELFYTPDDSCTGAGHLSQAIPAIHKQNLTSYIGAAAGYQEQDRVGHFGRLSMAFEQRLFLSRRPKRRAEVMTHRRVDVARCDRAC